MFQLHDSPCATYYYKQKDRFAKISKRLLKFKVMLAAIEENSGKMIKITEINWNHDIQLKVDKTKPPNSRITPLGYQTTCLHNNSKLTFSYTK